MKEYTSPAVSGQELQGTYLIARAVTAMFGEKNPSFARICAADFTIPAPYSLLPCLEA